MRAKLSLRTMLTLWTMSRCSMRPLRPQPTRLAVRQSRDGLLCDIEHLALDGCELDGRCNEATTRLDSLEVRFRQFDRQLLPPCRPDIIGMYAKLTDVHRSLFHKRNRRNRSLASYPSLREQPLQHSQQGHISRSDFLACNGCHQDPVVTLVTECMRTRRADLFKLSVHFGQRTAEVDCFVWPQPKQIGP